MNPDQMQNMQFGGGVSGSIFSPIVLVVILLAGILMWVLPRNKVIIPFFTAAMLVPMDQILLIGPLHFPMLRVLLLFGFARIFWAKFTKNEEIFTGGINGIDMALMAMVIFGAVDGVLLWGNWGEVVYQSGGLYTASGTYSLLRYLIRDEEDAKRTLRVWACVAAAVAAIMICEQLTGKNPLYMAVGGARAFAETVDSRNGSFRATGSFGHPILAGTFGGISLPLFVGLWWNNRKDRTYAGIGVIASLVMALTANSSTALLGGLGGIIALFFWTLRRRMRLVRWGIIGTLFALQMYMKSPVWHIISDIDFTGSSSSYHRYMLVDQCLRHFSSWFLVGTKDFGTWGWDMWDLSNQYVATADTAGLIPLISLIAILVFGFKYLGRARGAAEAKGDEKQELFIWALAASLFSNLVAFFGISYFDQTIVGWYAILAVIAAVTLPVRAAARETSATAAPQPFFTPPQRQRAGIPQEQKGKITGRKLRVT